MVARAATLAAIALIGIAGCGGSSSAIDDGAFAVTDEQAAALCQQLRDDLGAENVEPDCEAEQIAGRELP